MTDASALESALLGLSGRVSTVVRAVHHARSSCGAATDGFEPEGQAAGVTRGRETLAVHHGHVKRRSVAAPWLETRPYGSASGARSGGRHSVTAVAFALP